MVRDDRATWKSNYFEKMIVCIVIASDYLTVWFICAVLLRCEWHAP